MEKSAAFEAGFIDGIEKVAKEGMSDKKKALIAGGVATAGTAAGLTGLGHAMGGGSSPMGGIRAIQHAHDLATKAGKPGYAARFGNAARGDSANYVTRLGRALRMMRAEKLVS